METDERNQRAGLQSEAFVPLRRFVPAWVRRAQVDESRVASIQAAEHESRIASTQVAGLTAEEAGGRSWGAADGFDMGLFQEGLPIGRASEPEKATPSAAADGLAAFGAFMTLAAGFASQEVIPLLTSSPLVAEDLMKTLFDAVAIEGSTHTVSAAPLMAAEEALMAFADAGASQVPALLAGSVALASVFRAAETFGEVANSSQLPTEVSALMHGQQAALVALNETAQALWARSTGDLSIRAAMLLHEVSRLAEIFKEETESVDSMERIHEMKEQNRITVAVRCGSARHDGKDWVLPLQAQIYKSNEWRQKLLTSLCRKLLLRTIGAGSEAELDEETERLYEERSRLLLRSLQIPITGSRSSQRFEVRIGNPRVATGTGSARGWRPLPPTDSNGVSESTIRFDENDIAIADRIRGKVSIEVRLTDSDDEIATSTAHLVDLQGLSVISDIDDTVKVTEVFQGHKAVLKNTFLRQFEDVPGMAELYRGWAQERGAKFHYVSKSPPELHGPLMDFLKKKGFPVSSVHLCPLWGRDRASFKLREVESLLAQFPSRTFILVGDSGEVDAQVYSTIVQRYPDRIEKVFIREVTASEEELARTASNFKGIPLAKWQVFRNAEEVTLPMSPPMSWASSWFPLPNVAPKARGEATVLQHFGLDLGLGIKGLAQKLPLH